jgi:hypothetical protein
LGHLVTQLVRALLHFMGLDDGTGPWYLFWSGFGANLGELAIVFAAVAFYRRHTCHVHRCWRLGRHPVEGSAHVVCRRHHPEGAPTPDQVRERHRQARERE